MKNDKNYNVGIYIGLSQKDIQDKSQKILLTNYVKKMGWELKAVYQEDDVTLANKNQSELQRMMADVMQGSINTILVQNLSCLGRNYLEVGNLIASFLPEHGCELISLDEKPEDIMILKNWFDEQHCKSAS